MKYLITLFCVLTLAVNTLPQNRHRGGMQPQKRINQLEKVKLLEILELDDDTAVKFFRIKDQHQSDMMALREKQDKIIDIIEETLLEDKSRNTSSLNNLISDYEKYEMELNDGRSKYLNEVQALLTPEKYARFIVFERNFRAEIRGLIMGERMKRRGNPEE